MAHFKISLAGQLHFAPQAGDWSSLFVLGFVLGTQAENLIPYPTSFPTIHPHKKNVVATSMANTQAKRALTLHLLICPLRENSHNIIIYNHCQQQ